MSPAYSFRGTVEACPRRSSGCSRCWSTSSATRSGGRRCARSPRSPTTTPGCCAGPCCRTRSTCSSTPSAASRPSSRPAWSGDLHGVVRWRLSPEAGGTRMDFEQDVHVTGRLLRAASYAARPLLHWNHDRMMAGCIARPAGAAGGLRARRFRDSVPRLTSDRQSLATSGIDVAGVVDLGVLGPVLGASRRSRSDSISACLLLGGRLHRRNTSRRVGRPPAAPSWSSTSSPGELLDRRQVGVGVVDLGVLGAVRRDPAGVRGRPRSRRSAPAAASPDVVAGHGGLARRVWSTITARRGAR